MFFLNKSAGRKGSGYNITANDVVSFANRFGFTPSLTRGSKHTVWEKELDNPIRFFNGREEIYTDRLYISYGMGNRGGDTLKPPESKSLFRVAQALGQEAVDYFLNLAGLPQKNKGKDYGPAEPVSIPFFSNWAIALENQIKADLYHKKIRPEDYFENYVRIATESEPTINEEEAKGLIKKLVNLIGEGKEYFISKINISDFLTALNLLGDNSDLKDIADFIDVNAEDKDFTETIKYLIEKGAVSQSESGLSIIDAALKNILAHTQNNKLFKLSRWLVKSGLKKESKLLLAIIMR